MATFFQTVSWLQNCFVSLYFDITCFDSHFVVISSDAEFAFSSLLGSTYERLTRQIGLSRYGFHSLSFDHRHDWSYIFYFHFLIIHLFLFI